jgi:predicted Zn-dependent protease with MMP-like domain
MTKEKFEELVAKGIEAIPERFLEKLENVEICVEERPTALQKKGLGRENLLIFGLYQGIPRTKRWHYGQALPDKITIFKEPIEKVCKNSKEIEEKVKKVIWHEIAHHFGMGEDRVRKAERNR